MKPMTRTTLQALRLLQQTREGHAFIHHAVAKSLLCRGLVVSRGRRSGGTGLAEHKLKLTDDGAKVCQALFGPTRSHAQMNDYYVSTWQFETEDTADVFFDGSVFTSMAAAKDHATLNFIAMLDYDFAPRVRPIFSRRLGKPGYIIDEVKLRHVRATSASEALDAALTGRGEELNWAD